MKIKLIILSIVLSLFYPNYIFVLDQHSEASAKAVAVGNKICPVSGDKVPPPGKKGAMGEAGKYEYKGKIYNLCCKMCIKDFKKNPEKYSKIADEEAAKEKNK